VEVPDRWRITWHLQGKAMREDMKAEDIEPLDAEIKLLESKLLKARTQIPTWQWRFCNRLLPASSGATAPPMRYMSFRTSPTLRSLATDPRTGHVGKVSDNGAMAACV
jgi:hypothetical protein